MADALVAADRARAAARLVSVVERWRQQTGTAANLMAFQGRVAEVQEAIRRVLDAAAVVEEYTAGQMLSLEEAGEFALQEVAHISAVPIPPATGEEA
jgi:hypothetical protein